MDCVFFLFLRFQTPETKGHIVLFQIVNGFLKANGVWTREGATDEPREARAADGPNRADVPHGGRRYTDIVRWEREHKCESGTGFI